MYKKLAVFTFLSLMGVAFLELAVFAEGPKSPASQMCMASMSGTYSPDLIRRQPSKPSVP